MPEEVVVAMRGLSEEGTGALVPVLSLRDYFAAMALTGLATKYVARTPEHYAQINYEADARAAYHYADCMLAERNRKRRHLEPVPPTPTPIPGPGRERPPG